MGEKQSEALDSALEGCLETLRELIESLELSEKVEALNKVRRMLSHCSPFNDPVDLVVWVPSNQVYANDYNPNKVAPFEMELLHTSIRLDDFTQPIVSYRVDPEHYEITDGFHRNKVGRYPEIAEKHYGYLPLTIIDKPLAERIGSTIRHNRARGTHQIRSMSEIVLSLTEMGWSESEIGAKLGMEPDEIIRLKQITGLKAAFQNHEFSKSWTEFVRKNYPNEK